MNIGERRIEMEDRKIVQLLFARAENAISELSIRFDKQLYRIAYNILENQLDAQECTNDTYLALWNAIPPVSPDPLAPYVYRTGSRRIISGGSSLACLPHCFSVYPFTSFS